MISIGEYLVPATKDLETNTIDMTMMKERKNSFRMWALVICSVNICMYVWLNEKAKINGFTNRQSENCQF
jgi:hypothetical protein